MKLFWTLLAFGLIAGSALADERLTGHNWRDLSDLTKAAYMRGFIEGYR